MAHQPFWVRETGWHDAPLPRLTDTEHSLYNDLRFNHLGERVRLEQEKISFTWLKLKLRTLPELGGNLAI